MDKFFTGAQGNLLFIYLGFISVFPLEDGNTEGGDRFLNFNGFFVDSHQIV